MAGGAAALIVTAGMVAVTPAVVQAAPGGAASVYFAPSYEVGTIGSRKDLVAPLECPANSAMVGARTENRNGVLMPTASSILVVFDIECASITVSPSGTVTTGPRTWVQSPRLPQWMAGTLGNTQEAHCPANAVVHRMAGDTFVGEGNNWPSRVHLECQPLTLTDTGQIRVNRSSQATTVSAGANLNANGLQRSATYCGPAGTGNSNIIVRGYRPQGGGAGIDGINPSCATIPSDFGDAPASYGVASHELNAATYIGGLADPETASQHSATATGDNREGGTSPNLFIDDEEGVLGFPEIVAGQDNTYTVKVYASNKSATVAATLAGWVDFDVNGVFDPAEGVTVSVPAGTPDGSSFDLTWTGVAAQSVAGTTFARFRVGSGTELTASTPTGAAVTGEVEDYALVITAAAPELSIVKTSDATADARPGDDVTYTVTATNNGNADYTAADPAFVFDDLSGVLDDATFNDDATASVSGVLGYADPLLNWTGALAIGETVTISYSVTLGSGGDGVVRNVAWEPNDPENPVAPVCTPPAGVDPTTGESCAVAEYELPRLSIDKIADRTDLPAVGEQALYTVTVTNEGPGDYTAEAPATMTDDLSEVLDDATIDADSFTANIGVVSIDGSTLSWSGVLAAGESATISYAVTYTGAGDQQLRNLACVPISETAPGAASCDIVRIPGSGLNQWKTVTSSDSPAVAGSVLTYTLHFENDGPADATVDAVDLLTHVLDDADVTVEPVADAGLTAVRDDDTISITGSVPSGETSTVSYTVTIKADGDRGDDIASNFLLPNDPENPPTAPTDPSCEPADDEFPDCTTTPIAALEYSKSVVASSDPVEVGTVLTYTVTVENTGAATAPVAREDVLTGVLDDADLTSDPQSDTASVTVSDVTDGRFLIGGELETGETAIITYEVTVKADADRGDNAANNFLVAPGGTPPEACAEGSAECTSTPIPLITATKDSDPEPGTTVLAGQELTYTLTFTNSGEAAGAVDFTDDLSDVLDDAALTTPPTSSDAALGVIVAGETLVITGELQPAQTVTVSYTVTVAADADRENNVLGNVLADSDITDPQCGDAGVSCTEHPVPLIRDSKSVNPATGTPVVAGQELTYTLTFRNDGEGAGEVNKVDDLTHVLDDADVIVEPTASDPALTIDRTGAQMAITGTLAAGQEVTVAYTVEVRATNDRGDDILANFLLEPGVAPPIEPVCTPGEGEFVDCTTNPVGDIIPTKSVDPVSGTTVKTGDVLTYTLTFENVGAAAADVDYTDFMAGVLDDATLTGVRVGDGLAVEGPAAGSLHITGSVEAGSIATVTYTVTVKEYGAQGNHELGNFLVPAGQEPPAGCVEANPLCTVNPIDPPPSNGGLAVTGGTVSIVALTAALMALLAGGFLIRRRREV